VRHQARDGKGHTLVSFNDMGTGVRLLVGILSLCAAIANAHGHEHGGTSQIPRGARLGAVSFEISCKPQVKADFNRGVALLHSFWLDEAGHVFDSVATADPDCAMAYWGVAMSHTNQVNGGPSQSDLAPVHQALARADAAREKDSREAAYIRALHIFLDDYKEDDFYRLAARYTDAMAAVAAAYPEDLEAKVFYALALLNSDPPTDVALSNPRKAVAILSPILREHLDHPGVAHYIIHACDNSAMAREGLPAARRYASIAPAAPHALHMPSHIFARLGLWQDDIRSNLASETAAESPETHAGAESRLHAMEFLEYAYLQTGQIEKARAITDEAKTIKLTDLDPRYSAYFATVETRYAFLLAVETHDWVSASTIKPVAPGGRGAEGLAVLAHAISAGHMHDAHAGKEADAAVDALVVEIPPSQRPTATVPDEIRAWAKFSQGDLTGAITLLRPIADRQAKIGKGEVELPAREMVAEMLLLSGNFAEALAEYQASLASDPNRFNALIGAGEAAQKLGRRALAARYHRILAADCAESDGAAHERVEKAKTL